MKQRSEGLHFYVFHFRSEDFLNAASRRDTNSALGGYNKYNDPNHAVRRQRGHMRAVSEANLLDMEPRSRDRGHGGHRRSRSRSRIDHMESAMDDDEEPYQVDFLIFRYPAAPQIEL